MRNDGSQLPFDLDFKADPPTVDIDLILQRGHARLRRRRAAIAGSAAVIVLVGAAAATAAARVGGPRLSPSRPLAAAGLLARHPPDGPLDVLHAGRGWHPVVYRDTSGGLCEGWVDPTTGSVAGRCLEAAIPRASGTQAAVTAPVLVEPQAGVSGGSVEAFGLAAPATHSVELSSGDGRQFDAHLSSVRSAAGDRAWLASFPSSHHSGHHHIRIVARNRQGTAIGSATFDPPVAGSGASPSTPTPSPLPSTAEPTPSTTSVSTEPTPSDVPGTPQPTPSEEPASSDPSPSGSADPQLPPSPAPSPPQ